MNFNAESVEYELEHAAHRSRKMTSRLILHALKLMVLLIVLAEFRFGRIRRRRGLPVDGIVSGISPAELVQRLLTLFRLQPPRFFRCLLS